MKQHPMCRHVLGLRHMPGIHILVFASVSQLDACVASVDIKQLQLTDTARNVLERTSNVFDASGCNAVQHRSKLTGSEASTHNCLYSNRRDSTTNKGGVIIMSAYS